MNRTILAFAALAGLSACAAENTVATSALTKAGASPQTAQTAVEAGNALGQLTCAAAGANFFQPVGANVVGASAEAVADVCAAANPGSVPSALPPGAAPAVVTVASGVLADLNASKVKK